MFSILFFISTVFAFCDHYNNNTWIHEPEKECKFNPDIYTYTITTRTIFNLLDTEKEVNILFSDSKDVDVFLGLDKLKIGFPRKQYHASTEKLTISSTVSQEHHVLALYPITIEKDLEIDVNTENTLIRFSRMPMESTINYKLNVKHPSKMTIVKTMYPPSDHLVIKGDVLITQEAATSKRRKTCEMSLVGVGNVTTDQFAFTLYGNPLDKDSSKPFIPICEREGYKRFSDCYEDEYNDAVLSGFESEKCECKYLWNDEKGVHYNKWDCNEYSEYLDLVAYLPNAVVKGKWKNIVVRNTNATMIDAEAENVDLNNIKSTGVIKGKNVHIVGDVFVETIEAEHFNIEGKLFVKQLKSSDEYKLGCLKDSYYQVVGKDTIVNCDDSHVEL